MLWVYDHYERLFHCVDRLGMSEFDVYRVYLRFTSCTLQNQNEAPAHLSSTAFAFGKLNTNYSDCI